MQEKKLFEVLLYRIKEEVFYKQFEIRKKIFIDKYTNNINGDKKDKIVQVLENKFLSNYGGPWNYNQIVGSIEIISEGNQISGELWLSNCVKFGNKMTNKYITIQGKVFEIFVYNDTENIEIVRKIKNSISEFLKIDKRLVANFNYFDNVANDIDWKNKVDFKL